MNTPPPPHVVLNAEYSIVLNTLKAMAQGWGTCGILDVTGLQLPQSSAIGHLGCG